MPLAWVLAVVAGAIVFIFLITFAFKSYSLTSSMSESRYINYLDIQLDALSLSQNLYKTIDLDQETIFTCDQITVNKFSKTTQKIIFSNAKKGKSHVFTKSWEFPYKITNIFYITPHKIIYTQNQNQILELLPDNFEIIQGIPTKPKYNIFSTKKSFSDEITLGATFTNNFKCIEQQALNQLRQISELYKQKASLLSAKNPGCSQSYNSIIQSINNHISNPTKDTSNSIDQLNTQLRLSCTALY